MKSGRQRAILEILERDAIDTQFKLMQALAEQGFHCTQATLSRDIRELKLVKRTNGNGLAAYRPASDDELEAEAEGAAWEKSLVSAEPAQNLIVVKTQPGAAGAVQIGLEAMKPENLVGVIAGENTLFLAMRDNLTARKLCVQLQKLM